MLSMPPIGGRKLGGSLLTRFIYLTVQRMLGHTQKSVVNVYLEG